MTSYSNSNQILHTLRYLKSKTTLTVFAVFAYVKNCFASNILDLSYKDCYVSFRLDIATIYLFGGVYIKSENSKHFTPEM